MAPHPRPTGHIQAPVASNQPPEDSEFSSNPIPEMNQQTSQVSDGNPGLSEEDKAAIFAAYEEEIDRSDAETIQQELNKQRNQFNRPAQPAFDPNMDENGYRNADNMYQE